MYTPAQSSDFCCSVRNTRLYGVCVCVSGVCVPYMYKRRRQKRGMASRDSSVRCPILFQSVGHKQQSHPALSVNHVLSRPVLLLIARSPCQLCFSFSSSTEGSAALRAADVSSWGVFPACRGVSLGLSLFCASSGTRRMQVRILQGFVLARIQQKAPAVTTKPKASIKKKRKTNETKSVKSVWLQCLICLLLLIICIDTLHCRGHLGHN